MEATTAVLLGSVAGATATLIGSLINSWYSSSQAKAQWDRQQDAEEKNWTRESQKVEENRVREERTRYVQEIRHLYQRCIKSLSALAAAEDQDSQVKLTDDKRLALVEEVHDAISALVLRRPHINPSKLNNFNGFTTSPGSNAVDLRDEILAMAQLDPDLFAQKTKIAAPSPKELVDRKGIHRIDFHIDEDFRREQLVKGVELPRRSSIECTLQELTSGQREKLLDAHFKSNFNIPSLLQLNLPMLTNNKTVDLLSNRWKARLNPHTATPQEILAQWEADYEAAMTNVKNQTQ